MDAIFSRQQTAVDTRMVCKWETHTLLEPDLHLMYLICHISGIYNTIQSVIYATCCILPMRLQVAISKPYAVPRILHLLHPA